MDHLPQPTVDVWSRFSADPRRQAHMRASDADRDVAASVINAAFSEGRLDRAEHTERLDAVMRARTVGEFAALLSDVVISARPQPMELVRSRRIRSAAVRSWVGLAALFNLIWLFTVLSAGNLLYYWPMWPMLGTAIPLLITWMAGRNPDDARREQIRPPELPAQ